MSSPHLRAAALAAALRALPPLPRAAFVLHRQNNLNHQEIGDRLSIDLTTVEHCIGWALTNIVRATEGNPPASPNYPCVLEAQARLLAEFTAYCAKRDILLAAPETATRPESGGRELISVHWAPHRKRWLRLALRKHEKPMQVPPALTFDQWLNRRDGPPGQDKIRPAGQDSN